MNRAVHILRSALLAATIAMLSSVQAQAAPTTALSGIYTGTIVDWPQGTTGTVRLQGNEEAPAAEGTVDAQGKFSLVLPQASTFAPQLSRITDWFSPTSSYGDPANQCHGQGTRTPDTAGIAYFDLIVATDGKDLAVLKLSTAADGSAANVGRVSSRFFFFDVPAQLDVFISCNDGRTAYRGAFPAGWSLDSDTWKVDPQSRTAAFPDGQLTQVITADPLPETVAWRLYSVYVGVGLGLATNPAGGFTLSTVVPEGPAASAGVLLNDVLLQVDGQDITKVSLDEVSRRLRGGPAGSVVRLGVKRGSEETIRTIAVTRREVRNAGL